MITAVDVALTLRRAGFSLIPISPDPGPDGKGKRPAFDRLPRGANGKPAWELYQYQIADEPTLHFWFDDGINAPATVCGAVSGNFETADFDGPKEEARQRFQGWRQRLGERGYELLLARLVLVDTPNGFHVCYRCEELIPGGHHPARRPGRKSPLIETRGERNYVLCPSPVIVHPSGKPYTVIQGIYTEPPVITRAERDIIVNVAREFDEMPRVGGWGERQDRAQTTVSTAPNSDSPWDDFQARGSWEQILAPLRLITTKQTTKETRLRRQGSDKDSASILYDQVPTGILSVFTSKLDDLPKGNYIKPEAYARLHHGGDRCVAVKALLELGYGKPFVPRPKITKLIRRLDK